MQDGQTSGGGAVSAIPATLGDVAIVSSSSARASHSHVVEDVMGLDDKLEEMFGDIVIEGVTEYSGSFAFAGVGTVIPRGFWAVSVETKTLSSNPQVDVVIGGVEIVAGKLGDQNVVATVAIAEDCELSGDWSNRWCKIMFTDNSQGNVSYSVRMRRLFH